MYETPDGFETLMYILRLLIDEPKYYERIPNRLLMNATSDHQKATFFKVQERCFDHRVFNMEVFPKMVVDCVKAADIDPEKKMKIVVGYSPADRERKVLTFYIQQIKPNEYHHHRQSMRNP